MPFIRCPACNARYKVAAEAGGRHAQCRKCGQGFRIPAFPARPAPPDEELRLSSTGITPGVETIELERPPEAVPAAELGGEILEAVPLTDIVEYAPGDAAEEVAEARGAYGAYLWSLVKSLAFPARFGDLIMFAIVWVILLAGNLAGRSGFCVGWAGAWIVTAWYWSFLLNVVVGAAAGEEDLPTLSLTEGWWDGVVFPFLKMLAALAICFLPMLVFLASTAALSALGGAATGAGWAGLLRALDVKTMVVAGLLLLAGGFLWPMLVLVVAVGNIGGFVRIDLIARTIARSLPAYLLTVLAVYVSLGMQVGFGLLIDTAVTKGGNPLQSSPLGLLLPPLLLAVEAYFMIVAMRAIGFYYHHFKHRFAWSWG
jgi:hypothetical protein